MTQVSIKIAHSKAFLQVLLTERLNCFPDSSRSLQRLKRRKFCSRLLFLVPFVALLKRYSPHTEFFHWRFSIYFLYDRPYTVPSTLYHPHTEHRVNLFETKCYLFPRNLRETVRYQRIKVYLLLHRQRSISTIGQPHTATGLSGEMTSVIDAMEFPSNGLIVH